PRHRIPPGPPSALGEDEMMLGGRGSGEGAQGLTFRKVLTEAPARADHAARECSTWNAQLFHVEHALKYGAPLTHPLPVVVLIATGQPSRYIVPRGTLCIP